MSFPMGQSGRAQGRGNSSTNTRGAGRGRGRGRGRGGTGQPGGQSTQRGGFRQGARGTQAASGRGNAGGNGFAARRAGAPSVALTRGSWPDRYDKLQKARERERADAIANNIIADPNRPTTLQNAVTPKGTCQEMCSEFERVERVVQKDVWQEETDPNHSAYSTTDREPDESRMVKKFRRSAAGVDEQLPSDLRPPSVLKRTCDFLFNDIIGNAPELGNVHHFVWDRTRAIRNDFSIQQVSDGEDLRFAVECFERIARFHIVSLHQLAVRETVSYKYDWQQDHEQLDRTLVSLMQLYDDSRGKIALPNEAEFRAYLVVFQIKDPDLEDRVQTWPKEIIRDARVRKAMTLYAAAGNTTELQGPLKPPATQVIAQQDWQRFWNLIASTRTSYLIGCVAEISFNMIRKMALLGLLRSGSQKASGDFTVDEVCDILALDSAEEVEDFCNRFNITFADSPDGQRMIDLSALRGRQYLPEPSPALQKQYKSEMVEEKRFGRTLSAVINGLTVRQAQEAGMINEDDFAQDEEMDEAEMNGEGHTNHNIGHDEDSLFLPEEPSTNGASTLFAPAAQSAPAFDFNKQTKSIFDASADQPKPSPFSFGTPSGLSTSPSNTSPFAPPKVEGPPAKPAFNFLSNATAGPSTSPKASPPPSFSGFAKPPGQQPSSLFNPAPGVSKIGTKNDAGASLFTGFKAPVATASGDTSTETKPSLFSGFQTGTSSIAGSTTSAEIKSSLLAQPQKPELTYKPPFIEDGSDESAGSSPGHSIFSPTKEGEHVKDKQSSRAGLFSAVNATAQPATTFTFGESPKPASSQAPKHVTFEAPPSTSPGASANPPLNFTSSAQPTASTQFAQSAKQPSSFNFTPAPETATQRRGSASDQFKPAKPSPLNQSFTSGLDTDQSVTAPSAAPEAQKSGKELFPGEQSNTPQSKPAAPSSKPTPEPDFTSIIDAIAREITLAPVSGLLDQYVDFIAGKVITDVQEKVYLEHVNVEAHNFRSRVLSHRYGKFWRDLCRRKRLAKQGRERRERTRRRLAQSKQEASETASLAGSVSFLGGSETGSVQGSVRGGRQNRQEEVDRMFQLSMTNGRWSRMAKESEEARGGSKRPVSAHGMDPPQTNGHKRLKSTSHVDDSGRVSKPSSTNGSLQRSSYMDSLQNAPPRSTTKTHYFRLKAMGAQKAFADSSLVNTRKRQHSEMSESPLAGSPSSASLGDSHRMSVQEPTRSLVRYSSPASSKSLRMNDEDDALLARVKALRDNLKDDTSFLQAENARTGKLKSSTSSHGSMYESPSLERARVEARWRASQSAANTGPAQADVPAYRLRESKFVPRENYGKVIPRSSDPQQARPANSKISESTSPAAASSKLSTAPSSKPSQPPLQPISAKPTFSFGAPAPQNSQLNGSTTPAPPTQWSSATPSQFPAFPASKSGLSPSNPSTQSFGSMRLPSAPGKPAPAFGATGEFGTSSALDSPFDSSTQVPSSFMKPPPKPVSASEFQSAFGERPNHQDHTIAPQEIPDSLSASFGQPDMPAFQQNSYMSTQPDIYTMGDSNDTTGFTQYNDHKPQRETGLSAEFVDDEAEEEEYENAPGSGFGHANPYAVLSNGNFDEDEDDGEGSDGDDFEEDDNNQYAQNRFGNQRGHYPGSYQVDEYDETEEDGDIEDEDGEGYDEDDFEGGDTEEATDDEEDDFFGGNHPPSQPAAAAPSCTNSALAGKGQTETEAIELSD